MLSLLKPSNLGIVALAVVISFGAGYWTADNINDTAELKAIIKQQKQNVEILTKDLTQAEIDKENLRQLTKQAKELQDALLDPDNECFTLDDANKLRQLWQQQNNSTRNPE